MTNEQTPRPHPPAAWPPASTAYGLGRFELAEELLAPFSAVEGVVEKSPEERRGAVARAFLGHLARERGDLAEAATLYSATRAAHVRLGNVRGTAWAGHDLALLALAEGRTDEAERLLSESLELFDSIGYDWAAGVCACLLASAVVGRGTAADVDRAATLLARATRLHDESGDRRGIAQCLEVVAEVALARGAAATAARLVGAADAGRRRAAAVATELELRRLDRPRPAPRLHPGPGRRGARAARRPDHAPLGRPGAGQPDGRGRRRGCDRRRADRPAARGGGPGRRGPHQPADRQAARHQREDHRGPRAQPDDQARDSEPRGRRRLGRRPRADRAALDPMPP